MFFISNNVLLKGQFTRLKPNQKDRLKNAMQGVNNSQAKEIFLLQVWLEKAV
jgi:hypothetical protein